MSARDRAGPCGSEIYSGRVGRTIFAGRWFNRGTTLSKSLGFVK